MHRKCKNLRDVINEWTMIFKQCDPLTVFECQKFEDRVHDGHDEGQAQQVGVRLQESLFDGVLKKHKIYFRVCSDD